MRIRDGEALLEERAENRRRPVDERRRWPRAVDDVAGFDGDVAAVARADADGDAVVSHLGSADRSCDHAEAVIPLQRREPVVNLRRHPVAVDVPE